MYDGEMTVIDPDNTFAPPDTCYDPTYYFGKIGYKITATHKLAQDKPTVTVIIPSEYILASKRRSDIVQRLKSYIRGMEENTSTYSEMYDGEALCVIPSVAWNGHAPETYTVFDNTYWHEDGESSFKIEKANDHVTDKPVITWQIPCEKMNFDKFTATCADFCLREFKNI